MQKNTSLKYKRYTRVTSLVATPCTLFTERSRRQTCQRQELISISFHVYIYVCFVSLFLFRMEIFLRLLVLDWFCCCRLHIIVVVSRHCSCSSNVILLLLNIKNNNSKYERYIIHKHINGSYEYVIEKTCLRFPSFLFFRLIVQKKKRQKSIKEWKTGVKFTGSIHFHAPSLHTLPY